MEVAMSNPTTPEPGPSLARGPWRVLILDSSGDDPKWVLATVTIPSDIRPAAIAGGRYTDWAATTEWVRFQVGHPVALTPVPAIVWRVSEPQP
jgi:hypothetical protein